jgi:predicted aspartyl protease
MSLRNAATSFAYLAALTIGLGGFVSVARPQTLSAADRRDEPDSVLAKIRDAVGYRSLQKQSAWVLIEGVADHQGLRGPCTLTYTPDGKFLQRLKLKREIIIGYDGATCWGVDWSGTPRVLEFEEFDSQQILFAVRTGRWLAEAGPVDIAFSTSAAAANEIRFRLRLRGRLESMELAVNRATWLPSRLTARRWGAAETWEFQDYRPALGMTLAYRIVHRFDRVSDVSQIQAVRAAPSTGQDAFRPALDPPRDTRFDSATPVHFKIKEAPTGHLFVRPKVNGQEAGWFCLDTGSAGMGIAPKVADRLGMPAFGRIVYGGVGKPGLGKLREVKTFQLGSVTIDGGIFLEFPQTYCDALKRISKLEVVGTCGYDLFSRVVLELDLKNSTAACFEPARYRLTRGEWEPLVFNQSVPCVPVKFEGDHEGLFHLDTGAGSIVVFHPPAVEKFKLLEGRVRKSIKVTGVGGTVDAKYGPLAWFEVGGYRLEELPAIFLTHHEGALDQAYVAGMFGPGILKGMTIVFDYPHRRIAFVR